MPGRPRRRQAFPRPAYLLAILVAFAPAVHGASVLDDGSSTWGPVESWTVRYEDVDNAIAGTVELLAYEQDDGTYEFGLAARDHRLLFANLLPQGRFDPKNHSYEIGDTWFTALRPPATAGHKWTTRIGTESVTATILAADSSTIEVEYTPAEQWSGPSRPHFATYNARTLFFLNVTDANGMKLRFEPSPTAPPCQAIRVPRPEVLFSDYDSAHDTTVAGYRNNFVDVFDVPAATDAVALRMVLHGAREAFYEIRFVAPNATYSMAHLPEQADGPRAGVVIDHAPGGTWTVERAAMSFGSGIGGMVGRPGHGQAWGEVVAIPQSRTLESPAAECVEAEAAAIPSGPTGARDPVLAWLAAIGLIAIAGYALRPRSPLWFLLAKIRPQDAFKHPTRARIIDEIRRDPGITTQELRRRLELAWATSVHHLRQLEGHGFVTGVHRGRNRHWFAAESGTFQRDRIMLAALRSAAARRVLHYIEAHPGENLTSIARALGVRHTTVRFHVKRLVEASIVEARASGARAKYFAADRETSSTF